MGSHLMRATASYSIEGLVAATLGVVEWVFEQVRLSRFLFVESLSTGVVYFDQRICKYSLQGIVVFFRK